MGGSSVPFPDPTMPFLTVEYSANLDPLDVPALLLRLNQTIVDGGHADELVIKSRAIRFDTFQVGTSTDVRGFLHVKLALMSGRTDEVKKALAEQLMAVVKEVSPTPGLVQLAVELSDIDRAGFLSARMGGPG